MELEVENGKIIAVTLAGAKLPLEEPVELSGSDELVSHLKFFEDHFNLSKVIASEEKSVEGKEKKEWSQKELEKLWSETWSTKQKIFLKMLSKNPRRLTKKEVKEAMEKSEEVKEFSNYTMPGILSCIQRRAKHFGEKERFFESKYDGERHYVVKEKYIDWLKDYFLDPKGENK